MAKQLTRIDTRSMSRNEWLALRKKSIGGSDAAGIIGLNQYATPYTVWANKTGRLPDAEDNEAMRQGRDLEDYVAKRWEEATAVDLFPCVPIPTTISVIYAISRWRRCSCVAIPITRITLILYVWTASVCCSSLTSSAKNFSSCL